jgi:signal transduction histidine kinase
MRFLSDRSPRGRSSLVFNFAVGGVGLGLLLVATAVMPGRDFPPLALPLLGLFVFARFMRFEVPPNITASIIVPLQMAAIVLVGPVATAWIALPAFLAEVVKERAFIGLSTDQRRRIAGVVAFNLGMEALMTLAGGLAWLGLSPAPASDAEPWASALTLDGPRGYVAFALAFAVFKLVNEALMVAGSWMRGTRVSEYVSGARTSVLIEAATLPLGALLVIVFAELHPWPQVLFVATVLLAAAVVRGLSRTQASLATANADLERKVREVETLARVGRAISEDIELERLLESIYENCKDILQSDHFFIALWSGDERTLRIALEVEGGKRQDPKDIPLGSGLTSHVILSGRPLLIHDLVEQAPALPAAPILRLDADQPPNLSWLGVPMIAKGETVGAIVLQDPRPSAYDEDDVRVLSAIAAQGAISVKNARLHSEALHALRMEEENRQLKLLNAKKSEFVNMVAHQFRTPLTAVIGYANLLVERVRRRGGSDVPDLERHLGTVHAESKRLADMVEELLNVSRIRAGRLSLVRQRFDLALLARETIASHALLAEQRGLDVDLVVPPGQSHVVHGDSNHVRQAFANVLANALKYAPQGSRVEVRVDNDGDDVKLTVTDEGPGVPRDDLERVFDEFYRAGGATAEQPGTGLGLTIARGIVEAHGGRIGAERHGEGTAFWFTLPCEDVAEPQPAALREAP